METVADRALVTRTAQAVRIRRAERERGARPLAEGIPEQLEQLARPMVDHVVVHLTRVIRDRVAGTSVPRGDDLHDLVHSSTRAGIEAYLALIGGRDPYTSELNETFQRVGRRSAEHGRGLEELRSTMMAATHGAWRTIHRKCKEFQVPEGILGRLGDALFAHVEHLEQQMTLGYLEKRLELRQEAAQWGGGLALELVSARHSPSALIRLAARHNWAIPAQMQVVAIAAPEGDFPDLRTLPPAVLVHLGRPHMALIGPPADIARTLPRLTAIFGTTADVAVSWAVAPAQVSDAFRWARRALELRADGVLPGAGVVHCADHTDLLWMESEPLIRELVVARELAPLMQKPLRDRRRWAETLLLFLETHGSAPALAERLGVHPQTVRYRIRKLREMFGDRIDSGENLALLLALRSMEGRWPDEGIASA